MNKPWTADMTELDRLATVTREVWMMSITKQAPKEVIDLLHELTGTYEDCWKRVHDQWREE